MSMSRFYLSLSRALVLVGLGCCLISMCVRAFLLTLMSSFVLILSLQHVIPSPHQLLISVFTVHIPLHPARPLSRLTNSLLSLIHSIPLYSRVLPIYLPEYIYLDIIHLALAIGKTSPCPLHLHLHYTADPSLVAFNPICFTMYLYIVHILFFPFLIPCVPEMCLTVGNVHVIHISTHFAKAKNIESTRWKHVA
ncbi:hypothetical protein K474DRAFT_368567 [Panus rudis PR-1116 ss-1]|nr:hypothetical protein K474DRAFT_368567 [Panus rudis PR-1116 ss-1]